MSKGKKRFWSDAEKIEICSQTRVDGISVAQVARRYALNANLIHNWLKDSRFTPMADGNDELIDGSFFPVEVDECAEFNQLSCDQAGSALCATRVDLTLSDGRRVLVEGPTALCSVMALVEGLMP